MVLASGSRQRLPQEQIELLGLTAAELLNAGVVPLGQVQMAVVIHGLTRNLFLRSVNQPTEALCCVCGNGMDFVELGSAMSKTLTEIGSLS